MLSVVALAVLARSPFDVTQFGAVGDGKMMCTAAIQAAIDQAGAANGGTVEVPDGTFLTGSLRFRSNVNLHLDKGATLLGAGRRKFYKKAQWYALLIAENLTNFSITGEGTIDGQGKRLAQDVLAMVETGEAKIPKGKWRPSELDRPEIIEFDNCRGVKIQDVTIRNSACWVQTYRRCTNLDIERVTVDSKSYWNNDGFDIVDCRQVKVIGCDVDAADDGICLKSESRDGLCENVLIQDCKVRSSASAIKFGTASYGGFRNVIVNNIQIHDTYRSCVALESVDGGILDEISVSNIKAINTGNAFFIRLGHRNLNKPPGVVRRIILKDFDVQVPADQPDKGYPFQGPPFTEPHNLCPSSIVGHRDAPITDIALVNIRIRFAGGGSSTVASRRLDQVPERPAEYPEFTAFGELPAWGLYLRHVKGLTIDNFTLELDHPDYRPPFAADDIHGLDAIKVKVVGAPLLFPRIHSSAVSFNAR